MEHSHVSHLRYLDADDVGESPVDFGSLDVRGSDGSDLGNLDGFILDSTASRVLYAVVDSGGWFSSRRFLVPIGHATLADDRKAVVLDVTKDRLRQLPEFHEDRFREFSDEDFRTFQQSTVAAYSPDDLPRYSSNETWNYDAGRSFRTPTWLPAQASQDRLRPIESRPYRARQGMAGGAMAAGAIAGAAAVAGGSARSRETHDRELVTAREETHLHRDDDRTQAEQLREHLHHDDEHREPRSDVRDGGDASPHLGGRAQPGDILGVETGGETTHLGESGDDEDKRRRATEKAVEKDTRDNNR